MSAELRVMNVTEAEAWKQWEGQVVNGIYPLRRFLGGSDHGAIFLSEYKAGNLPNVAIKLVPADGPQAEAQLTHWRRAASLSHPHLIRLFEVGRCQLGEQPFLFVLMEHAEQTLAQVLSRRALNPDEAQEMLLPALDALAFLHQNYLVHSRLKPSNFLAVGDQLKLASDTVRPVGHAANRGVESASYDPPELKDRVVSTAGDVWSLGVTLVETLTQHTPVWTDGQREAVALPPSFPTQFASTVQRCLNPIPANRPTIVELQALYNPASPAPLTSDHKDQPPTQESPREATTSPGFPEQHRLLAAIVAVLLLSLALWVGLRPSDPDPVQADLQPPAAPAQTPVAPPAVVKPAEPNPGLSTPLSGQINKSVSINKSGPINKSAPADERPAPPAAASPSVLFEAIPEVPRKISDTIKGRVIVTVRVLVDSSGNVMGVLMENPGPSKYFARVASDAAREWKFVPADKQDARVWLLSFTFTRTGITTRAIAA